MKTAFANDRALMLPKLATALLTFAISAPLSAQQGGYSSQEFYRQGDAFSEKVSGFFSRLFKAGSQPASYPQPQYAQPGAYRTPATATAPRTQYSYPQAPATSTRPTSAAWPGYAQPQTPNYRTPPPVKSSSTVNSVSGKKSSPTQSTSTRKPIFSSSERTKTPEVKTKTPYTAPKESVVKAPTQENSPYSLKPAEPDPLPLPKQSFSDSSTSTTDTSTSKVTTNQSFPVATPSKTPGRVISPYLPNKELDVKGLASGSLALDPTTQKVFKVP